MKISVSWGAKNTGAKYTVKGNDLESALASLETRDEWGHFQGDLSYDSKGDAAGNVTSVVVKPTFTLTMPSWPAASKQPKACKAEWERMYAALRKHEDGHRSIFEKGVAKLETDLKGLAAATHSEIDALVNQALSDIQAAHNSYDAKTKHGQTEGVKLTITDECSANP